MKHKGRIIAGAALVLACGLAALIFYLRSPVLLVSDEPFTLIYGSRRAKIRQLTASLAAGRRVKQVMIADSAGTDLLVLALEEADPRPWCVVFPYRYAAGARRFHEQNPEIHTILLYGCAEQGDGRPVVASDSGSTGLFFEFYTDRRLDLYRTGRFAAILSGEKTGILPVFINKLDSNAGKDAFLQGFGSNTPELEPRFYDSYAALTISDDFPLVVIAGSGMEYFDKNPKSPLILFTWLDPALASSETLVIMDDSIWAQLIPALHMVKKGRKSGLIPSKPLIFLTRVADKDILRQLRKAAGSDIMPNTEQP